MKLKLQHFYLVLAVAATVVTLCLPLVQFIYADGAETMSNFRLTHLDGTATPSTWALGVLLILTAAVDVFALFVSLFQNFVLQKRCCILSMLLTAGYYLVLLLLILILKDGTTTLLPHWSIVLPLVSLIFNYMAYTAIAHTEARIIASASGFRLRD